MYVQTVFTFRFYVLRYLWKKEWFLWDFQKEANALKRFEVTSAKNKNGFKFVSIFQVQRVFNASRF